MKLGQPRAAMGDSAGAAANLQEAREIGIKP